MRQSLTALAILAVSAAVHADGEETVCPERATAGGQSIDVPHGWELYYAAGTENGYLSQVEFSSGHPDQRAFLKYSRLEDVPHGYRAYYPIGQKNIWVICIYDRIGPALVREVPADIRECVFETRALATAKLTCTRAR